MINRSFGPERADLINNYRVFHVEKAIVVQILIRLSSHIIGLICDIICQFREQDRL